MAAHRYWRVKFDTSSGAGCCAASEIQFREQPNGADVTGSGTALASSIYDGSYVAANAFDNNNGSIWHDGCGDHTSAYIGYDFGAGNEKDIIQFTFQSRGSGYGYRDSIKTGGLEYSDDGSSWTRLFSILSQPDFTDNETRGFGAPPAPIVDVGGHRYWRARMTTAGNPGTSFEGIGGLEFYKGEDVLSYFGTPLTPNNLQAGSGHNTVHSPGVLFGTQWGGTATEQWVGYDFGSGMSPRIDAIKVWPNSDDPARTWLEIAVEYSDNGTDWVESAVLTPATWVAATPQMLEFTPEVPEILRRRLIVAN